MDEVDTRQEVTFVSRAPCLTLSLGKETVDHPHGQAVFENGTLKTRCVETIAEIRKAIRTKPNVSQLVSEVDRTAAENIAKQHMREMLERNSHAHQGSLSSSSLRQNAQDVLMEQNRQEIESQMGGTQEEREAAAQEIAAAGIAITEKTNEVVRNNDLKIVEGAVLDTPTPKLAISTTKAK